jgi:hypothetical protein
MAPEADWGVIIIVLRSCSFAVLRLKGLCCGSPRWGEERGLRLEANVKVKVEGSGGWRVEVRG